MVRFKILILGILFSAGTVILSTGSPGIFAQDLPLEITVNEFDKIYKSNSKVNLLDVRTEGEYRQANIPGSVLLDVNEIMQQGNKIQSKIPFAKDQPLYIICRSGNRSLTATRILRSMGYTKAVSIKGGLVAWNQIGNSCTTKFLACAR